MGNVQKLVGMYRHIPEFIKGVQKPEEKGF
jgi:hypothetical protein